MSLTTTIPPSTTPEMDIMAVNSTFECVENGLFPLNDTNCQLYHLCFLILATFLSIDLSCPGTTRFNPDLQRCVDAADYPCNEELETTTITTTIMTTTVEPFQCSAPGSFQAPEDKTCKTYYFCVQFGPSFITLKLSCASGNYFDPTTSTCVTPDVYACGANVTTSVTTPSTTTTQRTTLSTTPSTSTTTAATICTASGRYPLTGDKTCQFYYLCLQTSTGFRAVLLQCPNITLFNPSLQLCVSPYSFVCPA